MGVLQDLTGSTDFSQPTLADMKIASEKEAIAAAIMKGSAYQTSSGASIILPDSVISNPAIAKAVNSGGLTKIQPNTELANEVINDSKNLTAYGLSIKPIYVVVVAVVLVLGYFIYKKFVKK